MISKTLLSLVPLLALASCGESYSPADAGLEGTWYFRARTTPVTYVGQHVIQQDGDKVLITYCDRSTYALRLVDSVLIDSNGGRYYLQPDGPGLLTGPGDTGQRSEVRRFSGSTRFEAGSLNVAVPSTESLAAKQDVCASKRIGRFGSLDLPDMYPEVLTISAPYKSTFVRIQIAFQSLVAGDYAAKDFDAFVHEPAGAAYVELTSPSYSDSLHTDSLQATSGEVHVRGNATENFKVDGSVLTTSGERVEFAADVVIKQPH